MKIISHLSNQTCPTLGCFFIVFLGNSQIQTFLTTNSFTSTSAVLNGKVVAGHSASIFAGNIGGTRNYIKLKYPIYPKSKYGTYNNGVYFN